MTTPNNFPVLSAYWLWKAADKEGMSEKLLKLFESETSEREYVQGEVNTTTATSINHDLRQSGTFFMESHHWMAGILFNYAAHANALAQWNMTLTAPETVQVTRYGSGEFYDFHADAPVVSAVPYIRRVSAVCCTSPKEEYEGGEFEFMHGATMKLDRGDILVFPSAAVHRVRPVTSGERRSLVTWVLGPNLK
jgi:predicted 2-oxoglutarate/Fe(II)-dependent dioxygenase YbiX